MRLGPWCAVKRPCIRPSYRVWALTGLAHQLARGLACTLVRLEVRLWEFLIALQATQPFHLLWRIHHVGRGFHLRGPNTRLSVPVGTLRNQRLNDENNHMKSTGELRHISTYNIRFGKILTGKNVTLTPGIVYQTSRSIRSIY